MTEPIAALAPVTVLLAAVGADHREPLARALRQQGFNVAEAGDTQELLDGVLRHRPKLILVDRQLAMRDGQEVFSALSMLARERGTPLVILTTEQDATTLRRIFDAGATDVLGSSASPDFVAQHVRFLVRAHGEVADLRRRARMLDEAQRLRSFGTWQWTRESATFSIADESARILGLSAATDAMTIDALLPTATPEARASLLQWLEALASGAGADLFELEFEDAKHEPCAVRFSAADSPSADGDRTLVQGLVWFAAGDPRALAAASPRSHDAVTGLVRRDGFLECVRRGIEARGSRQLAVLSIELDQFRAITGGLSHQAGQDLLAAIAQRLRSELRHSDVCERIDGSRQDLNLARIRGDQFAVSVGGLARVEDAARVAQRIFQALGTPFSVDGREVYVTASIGIASAPGDQSDAEELLKCAETAAYCAKQQGRSMSQFFTPGMNTRVLERLTLETHLRHALERGELFVHYQPRIEIATRRVVAFEALVRWRHPELGVVSPAQFIPIAEESGLIVPIGEWILETACRQARAWQDEGLTPTRMAVNLSPVQFRHPGLNETVRAALDAARLDARWLELELTETLLMQNAQLAVESLKRLKSAGIHLSIDDFGTGYSSLSYLKRFPIDALKIDQSFIREMTTNPDDAAIATSIILMGRSLKLRVVAEGVETPSQLAFLRAMQCDEVQGYLFSRPVPADEAKQILIEGVAARWAA